MVFLGEVFDGRGEGFAEEDVDFGELLGGGFVVEDYFHDSFFDALL